jgi:hypothetical protein
MGFQLSPGVKIAEIDLSTVVTGVATTGAVLAGPLVWGPVLERTLVDSENTLVATFGKPSNDTADVFFTAASFLQYGNNLNVVRVISTAARNAAVIGDGIGSVAITNAGNGYVNVPTLAFSGGAGSGAAATAQVSAGKIVGVTITNPGSGYTSAPTVTVTATGGDTPTTVAVLTAAVGLVIKNEQDYEFNFAAGQGVLGEFAGKFPGKLANGIQIAICDDATQFASWAYKSQFQSAPGTSDYASTNTGSNDELHVIVIDSTGSVSGVPGDVIEKYSFLSKAADAKDATGASIYYANVINRTSRYIRWTDHPTNVTNWGANATGTTFNKVYTAAAKATHTYGSGASGLVVTAKTAGTAGNAITVAFVNPGTNNAALSVGVSGNAITVNLATDGSAVATSTATLVRAAILASTAAAALVDVALSGAGSGLVAAASAVALSGGTAAVEFLKILAGGVDGNNTVTDGQVIIGYDLFNVEEFDFALILTASHDATVVEHCITEIAESRMDSVVFLSPPKAAVLNNPGNEHTDIVTYRNTLPSSSYAFMDSNWIKKYDKYSDLFRWVPANGDVAGLCVRTDNQRDPWFSPAGLNRGGIKGVVSLAWNPREAYRDVLYQAGVNPIVSFPGQGAVLFGDKTMLAKPSAFDRINVRRLFIVIEKAVARAAKYTLFEFNDEVTRTQFRGLLDPFLRDIQGRRGLYAFKVVCDASNNTPQTIDTNGFQGDIYLQPAKSINFISLQFHRNQNWR